MKSGRRSFESLRLCAWCGIAEAAANVGLLIASRNGYVSVVAVVASMYPAVTLVLASRVDHERIGPVRLGGLMLSAVVVSLVAIG
jgi:drug/metabolite transporter (DMT)-like permease